MEGIYVGVLVGDGPVWAELFRSVSEPTEESHGAKYKFVIGAFASAQAARLMADRGRNNPHLQSVDDAERMADSLYRIGCAR